MNHDLTLTGMESLVLAAGALGFGMILLIRGGNWIIDAATYIARHLGVSPLVIGLTVVAFGTSLPELIVSLNANFHDLPGIAVGNVLGSNVANILLIIGSTAFLTTLVAVPRELVADLAMMVLATALLAALMVYGHIGKMAGFTMIAILIAHTAWQYRRALTGHVKIEDVDEPEFKTIGASLSFLVAGLVSIALGAELLVRGATVGATVMGIPEAVIGLTIIAVGTSLPELSTCLIAAAKKQTGIVLGNIIGSNVFNILMIIGAAAVVKDIDTANMAEQLVRLDVWVTLGVSILFTLVLLLYRKVDRFVGLIFLVGYVAYIAVIYAFYIA